MFRHILRFYGITVYCFYFFNQLFHGICLDSGIFCACLIFCITLKFFFFLFGPLFTRDFKLSVLLPTKKS